MKSALRTAGDEYRALFEDNRWPASVDTKDSKAMNKNFGAVNMATTTDLKQLVTPMCCVMNTKFMMEFTNLQLFH